MSLPTFFYDDLAGLKVSSPGQLVELTQAESQHALRARRVKQSEQVRLIDGRGSVALGRVHSTQKKLATVLIEELTRFEKPAPLVIATAVPKGDRQRTMIDMLTQLGASHLIPLQCDRSVVRFSESNRAKWQRTALEACKQSGNPWLPSIEQVRTIKQCIDEQQIGSGKLLCYADINGSSIQDISVNAEGLVCFIGPEGGFTENELSTLKSASAKPIYLSPNILRTELAAVAFASALSSKVSQIKTRL